MRSSILLALAAAIALAPGAARADAAMDAADARMRAAGFVPMHEQVSAAARGPMITCTQWGVMARNYARARASGYRAENQRIGLMGDPDADRALLANGRLMIREIWATPSMTPAQAYLTAERACGWPGGVRNPNYRGP